MVLLESIGVLEGVLTSIASGPSEHAASVTGSHLSAAKYEMGDEELPSGSIQMDDHPPKRRKIEAAGPRADVSTVSHGREEEKVEQKCSLMYLFAKH